MKRIFVLALALLLFCAPARAVGYPPVVDNAFLLTRAEITDLAEVARALADEYKVDVVILTIASCGEKDLNEYASDWYDQYGFGYGLFRSGVLIVLDAELGAFCFLTAGRGASAFTDYAIDRISEDILPYFADGSYAEGFNEFLFDAEVALSRAEAGEPLDADHPVSFSGMTSSARVAEVRITLGPGLPFIALNVLMGYLLLYQTGGI